ncbi:MarP family serine protease [Phycicoccus sp. BSK3Z-2]|uniref:MarP family serine protease n=1 Tax=Phycicoccus avicenniae TaxID=2828860 RepID=A0A941D9N7_9MICO|nr:MarP family serine protease [Phycicoccus avicenniae]MBR7743400.1 MarP family serine protease [Phycicoccus avicenniae]
MTGSTVLDVVLVLVLLSYAASGWRQGAVAAVLGLLGLLGGAYVAIRFAPDLLEQHTSVDVTSTGGVLVVVLAVLAVATLAQGVALVVGARIRQAVRIPGYRALDSALGAVAVLLAAVFVLWAVAGAVRTGGPMALRVLVGQSAVVRAADGVVPPQASRVVDDVTSALDRSVFPRVFEGLGPEPISAVPAPDEALAGDPRIARALGSVIHVRSDATRCGATQVGSGWVSAPGVVVTNAHVVAGASRVRVQVGGEGPETDAQVVAFDPDRDVAVLAAPGLEAPALDRGQDLANGDDAVVAGFPGDAGLYVGAARVRDVLDARGADIYGDAGPVREIYSLRATVRQGASGGPVLDASGDVVGMVFATSLDDEQTGYALTFAEIDPVLGDAAGVRSPVATGDCRAA